LSSPTTTPTTTPASRAVNVFPVNNHSIKSRVRVALGWVVGCVHSGAPLFNSAARWGGLEPRHVCIRRKRGRKRTPKHTPPPQAPGMETACHVGHGHARCGHRIMSPARLHCAGQHQQRAYTYMGARGHATSFGREELRCDRDCKGTTSRRGADGTNAKGRTTGTARGTVKRGGAAYAEERLVMIECARYAILWRPKCIPHAPISRSLISVYSVSVSCVGC